jgi:hypothetical protein
MTRVVDPPVIDHPVDGVILAGSEGAWLFPT